MKRYAAPGKDSPGKSAAELSKLFLASVGDYGDLPSNLASYWIGEYTQTLSTDDGKKAAVDWFAALLSLLEGEFRPDMDFSDRDWDEIRASVSDEAENLDMDLVTSIMMIIVERGKA